MEDVEGEEAEGKPQTAKVRTDNKGRGKTRQQVISQRFHCVYLS